MSQATIFDMKRLGAEDGAFVFEKVLQPHVAGFCGNVPEPVLTGAIEALGKLSMDAAKRMIEQGLSLPFCKIYMGAVYLEFGRCLEEEIQKVKRSYA